MRRSSPLAALALLLLPACGGGGEPEVRGILVVTIDTLRRDFVGFHGRRPSPTPELDRIAAEAVVFDDAYAPAPITLPSHASLFTGLAPATHGVRDNAAGRLPAAARTLAERLRERGWRTGASVGAYVLAPEFGLDQGFERYHAPGREPGTSEIEVPQRRAAAVVDEAIAEVLRLASSGDPFLYWVHVYDPHLPYDAPGGPAVSAAPDALRAAYEAEVRFADRHLGRLFDALRDAGAWDELVVVVAGDHGEGLDDGPEPTHGYLLDDTTIRIPLAIRHPALEPRRVDAPVTLVDVLPTLLHLLGLPVEPGLDGRDLVPVLAGVERAHPSPLLPVETYMGWSEHGWAPIHGAMKGPLRVERSRRRAVFDRLTGGRDVWTPEDAHLAELVGEVETLYERMEARQLAPESVALDSGAREALAALGYAGAGGGVGRAAEIDLDSLPDTYERLPLLDRFRAAADLAAAGDVETALAELRELARLAPDDPAFLERLGELLLLSGEEGLDEAEGLFERAAELRPNRARVHLDLAACARLRARAASERSAEARAAGDEEAAAEHAREAFRQTERCEDELRLALALEPGHLGGQANLVTVLVDRADLAYAAGAPEEARRLLLESREILEGLLADLSAENPRRESLERTLASVRRRLGDG